MAQPSYERPPQSFQMTDTIHTYQNMSGGSKPKPSRLELMRQNYEKKRQKEVEDRLSEMRLQQAKADSGKVNSGGTVRAFFAERRAMEANMKDPYALPPIDRHFKKVKESSSSAPLRQVRARESYTPPLQHKTNSAGGRKPLPQYYRKKSKGIDKQNPLPPVQRGQINKNKPPTPNKRYETHHTLTGDDSQDDSLQEDEVIHREKVHVPRPPQKPNPLKTQMSRADSCSEFDETGSNFSEDAPPNLAKLKAIRQKRLSKQLSVGNNNKTEKLSDFQKWQLEQDKQRAERLEKHRQKTQSETGESLSTREQELLEKIKAEQDKLKEIKRLQQELEEQEKMENEDDISNDLMMSKKHRKNSSKKDFFSEERKSEITQTEPNVQATRKPVKVQPKSREKVKQKTIQKALTPEEPEHEDINEPKEDFTAFYEQAAQNDETVDVELSSCTICGRNFATDRLARHEKICNKNANSKRKKFDVQKQRVSGMEHAKYVLSGDYKKEPVKKV